MSSKTFLLRISIIWFRIWTVMKTRSRRTCCAASCARRTWCRCGRRRRAPCSWSSACASWPRAAATTSSRPSAPSGSQCTSPRWEIGFPRAPGSNVGLTRAIVLKEEASTQSKGARLSSLRAKWSSLDWCRWQMDAANVPLVKGRELNYKCQSCILTNSRYLRVFFGSLLDAGRGAVSNWTSKDLDIWKRALLFPALVFRFVGF